MKKLVLFAAVAFSASLFSCGNADSKAEATDSAANDSAVVVEATDTTVVVEEAPADSTVAEAPADSVAK